MKERLCGLVHQARLGSCGWRWWSLQQNRFMLGREVRITHVPHSRDALTRATAVAGRAYARKGREPYYAPNPLCGACFAKASQPEGMEKLPSSSRKCGTSEDMSKGARGGQDARPTCGKIRAGDSSGRYFYAGRLCGGGSPECRFVRRDAPGC